MRKTCDFCGVATTVSSFELWDGRCSNCKSGLTLGAACEDRASPPPTSSEVVEYLRYMDELDAIRRRKHVLEGAVALHAGAFFLFVWGGMIHPWSFFIGWSVVTIIWLRCSGFHLKPKCPRCRKTFIRIVARNIR